MSFLRTWIWILVSSVLIVVFAIPLYIVRIFGPAASWAVANGWARVVLWLLKVICGLSFTVEGKENLPADAGVALIKHSSAFETLAQLVILPQQCWVLKKELIWSPFFGWALMCLGAIPIDRSSGRKAVSQVLETGKDRIENGIWVAIFPEGTRVPAGETKRWGISGILLAQEAGKDITPIAHNAGYYWPREGWTIYPGTVRIRIGKPVSPAGKDPRELAEELQTWMDDQVQEMAPDLQK